MNIQPARQSDVEEIVELLTGWEARENPILHETLCAYTTRVYFENPWRDAEIAPIIARMPGGTIGGFLGLMPRPFDLPGQSIRVSVSSNFRVRTDRNGRRNPMVALRLLQAAMDGPQDVSIADGATDVSRRVWQGCGGSVIDGLSLDFIRALKPASAMTALVAKSGGHGKFSGNLMAGAAAVLDRASRPFLRQFSPKQPSGVGYGDFDDVQVVRLLSQQEGIVFQPRYSIDTYRWVSATLPARAIAGSVMRRMVLDKDGEVLGWFALVQKTKGVGDLAQIGCVAGFLDIVFDAVLAFAAEIGLCLLRGPVTKPGLPLLRPRFCFLNSGRWFLAHSRRIELIEILERSNVYLHMLEGERWILEYDKVGPDFDELHRIQACLSPATPGSVPQNS